MVDPNWGLMQGNNALNYMQYGMQIGRDARERQNAQELTAAESELFAKPNDPNALASYAKLNPKGAFAYRQDQQKSAAEQRRRELIPLAARGDETALLELWGADPDMAMKLDENSKKKAADGIKYVASAAYKIKQLPPEQRPAAWDAYIDQGVAQYPGLAEYRGKYSDQSLDSIVAKAGETKMFEEFQQPRYVPLGEQGAIGLQYGRPIQGGPTVNPAPPQQTPAAPPPPQEAIEDLRRNPKSAAQFDEIFGQGAAAKALGGASGNTGGNFRDTKINPIADLKQYGLTPTSGFRTQQHQDALRAAGKTKTKTGSHPRGDALDFDVPSGMTKQQAIALVQQKYPGARAIPSNGNSIHVTFPGWGRAPDVSGSRRRYGG